MACLVLSMILSSCRIKVPLVHGMWDKNWQLWIDYGSNMDQRGPFLKAIELGLNDVFVFNCSMRLVPPFLGTDQRTNNRNIRWAPHAKLEAKLSCLSWLALCLYRIPCTTETHSVFEFELIDHTTVSWTILKLLWYNTTQYHCLSETKLMSVTTSSLVVSTDI